MAEKDPTARLRRAVKENNLFLVKRLIERTDMRNPDVAPRKYTSLAWAAVLGHEETFEFLLSAGHDEHELSKDVENNTILMLLADLKPLSMNNYAATVSEHDSTGAALRMARLYFDRYPWTLDWSNVHGKTALHIASIRGNEELVRMLCDLGADFDLADNLGNTPLHYASSWGHVTIVQLLIERGCQYTVRNNEGFTALDYAYSFSTREALQETVRLQFELNKEKRRHIFAQAAARGTELHKASPISIPPPVPSKDHDFSRIRSGSGTSRTTANTSDSGDADGIAAHASYSSSSPSRPSTGGSGSLLYNQTRQGTHPSSSSSGYTNYMNPPPALLSPPSIHNKNALSPVANRMLERDADAMDRYLNRGRSGSSSTDNQSINPSTMTTPNQLSTSSQLFERSAHQSGSRTPKRLRPSYSAAQLRTPDATGNSSAEHRMRSGTNPSAARGVVTPPSVLARTPSISHSLRSLISPDRPSYDRDLDSKSYVGPPSQYAQFPEPPAPRQEVKELPAPPPQQGSRRKGLHILGKPLPGFDSSGYSHRRGASGASVRGF